MSDQLQHFALQLYNNTYWPCLSFSTSRTLRMCISAKAMCSVDDGKKCLKFKYASGSGAASKYTNR